MERTPPRRSARNMQSSSNNSTKNEPTATLRNVPSVVNRSVTAAKTQITTITSISSSAAFPAMPSPHQSSVPQVSLSKTLHIPSAITTNAPSMELLNNPVDDPRSPNIVQQMCPSQPIYKPLVESNASSTESHSIAGRSIASPTVAVADAVVASPESGPLPTVHAGAQSQPAESMLVCMQNKIAILQRQLKEAEIRLAKSELERDRNLLDMPNNGSSVAMVTPVESGAIQPTMSSQVHTAAHVQQHDSNMLLNASQQNVSTQPVYIHPATFVPTGSNNMYTNSITPNSVDSAIQLQRAANNQLNTVGYTIPHKKLIDLPEFSGQPEDWPIFYTAYVESTALYHYTNFENNQRLYKCLKGEARDVVKSLLIHPNNVNAAVGHLRTRFGRPETLIRSQLKQIREIPPISENNIAKLVQFSTTTKNLAIFLHSINGDHHLANPTLLEELLGKLPMSKRFEWAKRAATIEPYPNIQHFSDWLSEIAALISVVLDNEPREHRRRPVLHVADFQRDNSTNITKCPVCSAKHRAFECKRIVDASVSDRWSIVKRHRLCFSCLNYGHSTRDCHSRKTCSINGCGRKHNRLLHEQRITSSRDTSFATTSSTTQTSNHTNEAVLSCKAKNNTNNNLLFRVLPVTIHGPSNSMDTFALLDEGSSLTMVDNEVLEVLGVNGQRKHLDIQWFGGRTIQEPTVLVDLYVNGRGLKKKHKLRNIYGVSNLNLPTQTLLDKDLVNLHCSENFKPLLYSNVTPKLLIGLDHCHLGMPTETMGIRGHGPYAANTELGWVIFGPSKRASISNSTCLMMCASKELELHDIVADYFKTENIDVKAVPPIPSDEDIRAKGILEATTEFIDGRFQVGLLWKTDNTVLPESYTMALKRLIGIERKMKRNSEFATAYKGIIDSYLRKGYARKLLAEEVTKYHPRTWYLPHFAVFNPNKPTKMRLVFDAAACSNGTSLNSHLLKGPQDYRELPAILFHFREGPVAVCGDVMEMFHQVVVQPNDRHAQRFLWREGGGTKPPDVFEMVSMTFGAACSPCAAQHVKTVNALKHRHADNLRAVKAILEYHYVDDFVDSFESVSEAIKVTKQVCDIHKRAGFTLRHFASNSPDVSKSLGCDEVALNIQRKENFVPEKVLGMYWRPSSDDFNFEIKFNYADKTVLDGMRSPTKRELLSIVMSIFDPIGFLCNFTIVAKLLLREVWNHRVSWDEDIPAEVISAWESFRKQIPNVTHCHIPRHYFDYNTVKRLELHTFVDASEDAFAAVGYWRYVTTDGKIGVSFVSAKAKTAPLKPLTIPRLELQAAVLGVRLKNMILHKHSFKINQIFLWSDSSTVLHWINSEARRYKPFVAHRIAEILDGSKPDNWRWVPTADNAADEATRTKRPIDFSPSSRWFSGPTFLKGLQEYWPDFDDARKIKALGYVDEEIKPKFALLVAHNILIDFSRFSSFTKLRRTIAYILRFISRCRKQHADLETYGITAKEIEKAQIILSRLVQRERYAAELKGIAVNQQVTRDSELHQLCPYVDENGVLRVYGRIDAATWLPHYAKRPIIMPPDHVVTKLIVAYQHRKMLHQNTEATIAEIRRTFWIPRLRQVLRSVIANCVTCKISKAKPIAPLMGSLPQDRLTPYVRPFTFTGLDYFGPINVAIGRRREKRWVALFTCLTVRAIHLELSQDLSTDACILCIRNFVNRRGIPARLRSDNGTNFIGADKEAKRFTEVFDCDKIQEELSSNGVEWIFNWPSNPSEGGIWERMVQCVKRALWHTLKEESPKEHTLLSVLIEIENVVNSRPLTHIPVSSDQEEPLTPNHFLLGSANTANTPSVDDPVQKLCALRKQWRLSRQYRDRFWKRWISEYLPTLTRRVKWCRRERALQVGDLVLICEASTPRRDWCRGRVVQVYRGTDGEVRRADVRTSAGILRRPASKLATLDIDDGGTERSTGWRM